MRDAMPCRLSFDRVAAIYDETRRLAPRRMARVLAVLVDELRGTRVLEVGVGTGRYAVPLQKSGIRLVGVDISRKMVEFGLAKGLRDVVFADAARLPFVSGSFDVATTNHDPDTKIVRAHVLTPVTSASRMASSAWKEKSHRFAH